MKKIASQYPPDSRITSHNSSKLDTIPLLLIRKHQIMTFYGAITETKGIYRKCHINQTTQRTCNQVKKVILTTILKKYQKKNGAACINSHLILQQLTKITTHKFIKTWVLNQNMLILTDKLNFITFYFHWLQCVIWCCYKQNV